MVVDPLKRLVGALAAPDGRQGTHAAHELVGAGRGIPGFAGLLAHEAGGKHISASPEEGTEETYLLGGRPGDLSLGHDLGPHADLGLGAEDRQF